MNSVCGLQFQRLLTCRDYTLNMFYWFRIRKSNNTALALLVILSIDSAQAPNEYCQLNCGIDLHTLCEYGKSCYTTCVYGSQFNFMTDAQRELILHQHNIARNNMALGEEFTPGFWMDEAANMKILSWSKEAEYIASCKAKHCDKSKDLCRTLKSGITCGQNMYHTSGSGKDFEKRYNVQSYINESVSNWYAGSIHCEGCDSQNYRYIDAAVEEFSNIVWAETEYVGCAYMLYQKHNTKEVLLYCNYCPEGAIAGQPYYKIGEPGPGCGKDKRYPSLCGEQRPIDQDLFDIASKSTFFKSHVISYIVVITTTICNIIDRYKINTT